MKTLVLLTMLASVAFVHAEDRKITGTFTSVPMEEMLGLPSRSGVRDKELSEKMRQTLVITEKDLTLKTAMGGGIYMTYTVQGDFLLGKTVLGDREMFYPIYLKDADTLFMAGQKFVRKAAEEK